MDRVSPSPAKVTAIVLNYNQVGYTLACLASLAGLEDPVGVVVVDNGSHDDSVAQLRAAHPDLDLLTLPQNVGFARANNLGYQHLLTRPPAERPEFIWLLNNDTLLHPRALGELLRTIQADERLGAVASILYDMGTETVQAYGGGKLDLQRGRTHGYLRPVADSALDFLVGTSLLLRCRAVEEVGLLDEIYRMYWEDTDLSMRLKRAGWKLGIAHHSQVWHVGSASSGGNTRRKKTPTFERLFAESSVLFFRRYAPRPVVPLVRSLGWHFVKRLLKGEWPQARGMLQGVAAALRQGVAQGPVKPGKPRPQ